jgi:Kdo2-lipid IVA lauroyltransferase/acyltransferase
MSVVPDWAEYVALSGFLWFCRILPRRAALAVGKGLGDLLFDVVRIRRAVALQNLRASFPEKTEREIIRIARASYRHFAQTAIESGRLPTLTSAQIAALGEVRGREHVEWVAAHGRGAILLTGHFGNWEWAGALLPAMGYPTQVVVGEQHNPRVGELMDRIRRATGVGVLSAEKSLKGIIVALRNKELVAIVADQDAGRDGIFVDFLGRPASTAVGPVRLAHRFDVPILPGFAVRLRDGRYRLQFEPPILIPADLDESRVLRPFTEMWSRILEEQVRRYPEQWFWMHRRWKTRPPTETAGQDDRKTAPHGEGGNG